MCSTVPWRSIHFSVGAVSIAGADPDLWSVLGGNHRVAEELLRASRAALLTRTVTHVSPTDDGRFMVSEMIMVGWMRFGWVIFDENGCALILGILTTHNEWIVLVV